jgi:hypothetical protein
MLDAKIPPMQAYSFKLFASSDRPVKIKWDGARRRHTLREGRLAAPPGPGLPRLKDLNRVRPELEGAVSYQEETARGHFRAPAFMGLVP